MGKLTRVEKLIFDVYEENADDLLEPREDLSRWKNADRKKLGQYLEQNLQQRLERIVRSTCSSTIPVNRMSRSKAQEAWRDCAHEWLTEIEDMPMTEILTHEDETIRKFGRIFQRLLRQHDDHRTDATSSPSEEEEDLEATGKGTQA